MLLFFIFLPLLVLLVVKGKPTIGLIVLTGIVGASLARQQGLSVAKIQREMATGIPPTKELVEG